MANTIVVFDNSCLIYEISEYNHNAINKLFYTFVYILIFAYLRLSICLFYK